MDQQGVGELTNVISGGGGAPTICMWNVGDKVCYEWDDFDTSRRVMNNVGIIVSVTDTMIHRPTLDYKVEKRQLYYVLFPDYIGWVVSHYGHPL